MSESSPAFEDTNTTLVPDANSDVQAAVSSTTETQGVEQSPVDLVMEALGSTQKESSPDSERDPQDPVEPTSEQAQAGEDDAKQELGEITEEELKRYGPKTQARIKQLLDQRHEKHQEVEALKPKAAQYDAIMQFAEASRLSKEDVGSIMEIGSLVRNAPEKALEKLVPIVQHLQELTGQVLPADVQERVRLGYISEEDARRMVRSEKSTALTREQLEQARQDQERANEAAALQELQQSAKSTAETWEATRKRTDPDWQLKQRRVGELAELEVRRNGFPESKAKMVELLDTVYAQVNQEMSRLLPRPKAVTPVTGTASAQATSEPKTSQEAALRALGLA